ncbi:MAG: hypothetical protein E7634_04845 [Ruminococcaceae bacterium]|nr:hypothetical protein [Oscillospiraceae bacterium]
MVKNLSTKKKVLIISLAFILVIAIILSCLYLNYDKMDSRNLNPIERIKYGSSAFKCYSDNFYIGFATYNTLIQKNEDIRNYEDFPVFIYSNGEKYEYVTLDAQNKHCDAEIAGRWSELRGLIENPTKFLRSMSLPYMPDNVRVKSIYCAMLTENADKTPTHCCQVFIDTTYGDYLYISTVYGDHLIPVKDIITPNDDFCTYSDYNYNTMIKIHRYFKFNYLVNDKGITEKTLADLIDEYPPSKAIA